jgi:hypothetical protein
MPAATWGGLRDRIIAGRALVSQLLHQQPKGDDRICALHGPGAFGRSGNSLFKLKAFKGTARRADAPTQRFGRRSPLHQPLSTGC